MQTTTTERPASPAGAIVQPGLSIQNRKRQTALQNLARLRKQAADEIDRLIRFLDESDLYVTSELEENGDELDQAWREGNQAYLSGLSPLEDDEDGADDEPSLGSHEITPAGAACYLPSWSRVAGLDVEYEHDGAEPDVDNEPSLGWTESGFVGVTSSPDAELAGEPGLELLDAARRRAEERSLIWGSVRV